MQFEKTDRIAYINFLKSKYEMWTGEVLVKSYPYHLGIDPSSFCQLRCPLCPTGIENESKKSGQQVKLRNRAMLSEELLDALLDELGDYLFLIMFYNWGEPLLNKNLPNLIRKVKAHNIYTEIHTNLSLRISTQFMEDLLLSGVNEIAASIDGFSQESYQTYRQGGNFKLAKNNIERLAGLRDKLGLNTKIIWNFLVFSFNEHEIEATREHCEQNRITFNQREAFIDNPDWLPSYRKNEVNLQAEIEHPATNQVPEPTQLQEFAASSPCAWHYNYSIVNADGSVSPCCAPWEQEHDFGLLNPGYVSFADVWNNNLYRKSRGVFAHEEIKGLDKIETLCLKCPFGESIQNLYSPLDADVINQFNKVFKGSDPLLEHAFTLLGDKEFFIEFFKDNLADGSLPIHNTNSEILIKTSKGHSERLDHENRLVRSLAFVIQKLIRLYTKLAHHKH